MRAAQRAVRHPWGWAWWDRRFPQTWSMNAMRAVGPLDGAVGASEFTAEVDRLFPAAPHRFAIVEDEGSGERIGASLRERGWRATRLAVMALREPRDRDPAPGLAREAGEAAMQAVEVASMLDEDELRGDPDGLRVAREIIAGRAVQRAAVSGSRRFVGAWDGRDGAVATLYGDGRTAQVESVGTVTALRGRGLARAVVSAAVDAAVADGHELVFILADEDDWPKELYVKLGFRTVGHSWQLVRRPGGARQRSSSTRRPPAKSVDSRT